MSTCREVITRALRWINATGTGNRVPSADMAQDALEDLQALYFDLIEKGSDLQNVTVTAAYTAGENQRIYGVSGGVPVITFPASYSTQLNNPRFFTVNDAAVNNAVRPPSDFAVVIIAGSSPVTKVYDANLASWVAIESLALADEAPWSRYLGLSMGAMLAALMGDQYGAEVPDTCVKLAEDGYSKALARLLASGPDEGSAFFSPDRMRY